jgi:ABC-type Fe3+/spermidine/putrescine transport system ATPase subunit
MINIKDLSINIGEFSLRDLSLTIQDREYFVILGPSGAGKTVLMECLAGIHKVRKGEIWLDDTNVTRLAPEERNIGYVPQDYVLFPFLNVRENILFGLKRAKHHLPDARQRLLMLAELLGITHLLDRNTLNLSGGEKQRAALARALATSPRILLMDEPLNALDVQTSNYLRLELRRIHRELGVTTIHITHNHTEAEELADRLAVMSEGRIEQVGRPQDIFFAPGTAAVSDFIGSLNILYCDSCRQLVPGLMEVDCGGLHIVVPHDEGNMEKIAISPRDVYVSDILPPGPAVNRFQGVITAIDFNTTMAGLNIQVGRINIKAEMHNELAQEMGLITGQEVYLILKLRRLKVLGDNANGTSDRYGGN